MRIRLKPLRKPKCSRRDYSISRYLEELRQWKKIYFIGINGIGMSGLAKIMKCKGYDVKGADICSNYVTEELLSMGITVYNEHDEENVKGADFVIASTAIKETNPRICLC